MLHRKSERVMRKLTLADMHNIAESRGGKCFSGQYLGAHIKLLWECDKGHQWNAPPASIKRGSWCPVCGHKKAAANKKLTIEEMNQLAMKRGGKCLSAEYLRALSKLAWECSEGHQWEETPAEVKRGAWCPICRKLQRGESENVQDDDFGCETEQLSALFGRRLTDKAHD